MTKNVSKYLMILLSILITFIFIPGVSAVDITVSTTGYIIEGQSFVGSSTPLTDAITASQNNDIIYLEQGHYKESITIDKKLSIIGMTGESKENVKKIVIGGDDSTPLNTIISISSADVSISNITLANATNLGLRIPVGYNNCTFDNIYVYNSSNYGIRADTTVYINNSIFEENGFGSATGSGICLYYGIDSIIQNTKLINNNRNELYANSVQNLTVINNEIIINNENDPINTKRNGLVFLNTTKCFIAENSLNSISHSGNGIDNTNSNNNMIYKNNITGFNWNGLALDGSNTIAIIQNNIYGNAGGLQVDSTNCTAKYNKIYDNDAGIVVKCADITNNISKNWIDVNNSNVLINMDSLGGTANLTHNYWGTNEYNPINSKMAEISGKIYFAPYYTNEEFNELYSPIVNINQNKSYSKIQDAIDDADEFDIINVKDGIYEEQICINKSITLNGSNNAVLKLPESPNQMGIEEDNYNYVYNVILYGGTVVNNDVVGNEVISANINGFKIDANNYSPAQRLAVVLVRNANSNITNLNITNIVIDTKITLGIFTHGKSNTNITNNTIASFSRGGICAKGGYANITGNIVAGPGKNKNVTWAPNGIQIGNLAEGIVSKNTISGCGWPGEEWTGTALMIVDTDNVSAYENNILNSETGIYVVDYPYTGTWANPVKNITVYNNILINNTFSITVANNVSGCNVSYNKIYNSDSEAISVSMYSAYTGLEPRDLTFNNNEIYNSKELNVYISNRLENINMSHNYWGTGDYLDIKGKMYGSVIFTPYYSDSNMDKLIRITDEINYQFVKLSERLDDEGINNNIYLVNETNYESFAGLELEKEDITKIKFTNTLNLSKEVLQVQLINLKDNLDIKSYGVYLSGDYCQLYNTTTSYEFNNIDDSEVLNNLSESELFGKLVLLSDGNVIKNNSDYVSDYKLINNTFVVNSSEFMTCYLDIEKPTISSYKISPNGVEVGTYNITTSANINDDAGIKQVYVILPNGTKINLSTTDNITYNTTFEHNATSSGTFKVQMIAEDISKNNNTKLLYLTVINSTVKEALGNSTSNITIDDEVWSNIEAGGIKQLNNTNISLTEITVKNESIILPKLENVSVNLTEEVIETMEEVSNSSDTINVSNATTEEEIEAVINEVINKTKLISSSGFNISNMTLTTTKEGTNVKSEIKFTAKNTTKKGYTIMRLPLGDLKLTGVLVNNGTGIVSLKENDYNSTLGWYRLINNKVVELTLIQDPDVSLLFESALPSQPDTPSTQTYVGGGGHHHSSEISTITLSTGQTVSKVVGEMLNKARIVIGASADAGAANLLTLDYQTEPIQSCNISDITITKDTLILGGPKANPLAEKYDMYFEMHITNEMPGENTGIIQTQKINGYQVIYIAGSDRVGTKTAVQYYLSMTENITEPLKIKLINGEPTLIN
ncbi:right-handed parallel beta-helix repeat-containing protein [Methanococcus voltae]|uniref:Right handed beta helix domain-containing protein n=1 Tax=Methanococcus voltae (strain ATCC BAA-1334 / A3) TaxID=456320 RepID=D7DS12_METV3|nr:right-handed parallel beta-helix repeat-containing protein [Methanococcus voltae]MCS3901447.1 hypothetical protein [Methanococcus voltae]